MKRIKLPLFICLFLSSIIGARAQAAPKTVCIGGRIKDKGGNGVQNVLITASRTNGPTVTGRTSKNGRYAVCGLTCGTYTVSPTHARYSLDPRQVQQWACNTNVTGLSFTARPQASTPTPRPTPTPALCISGHIRDEGGSPIVGATVTASRSGAPTRSATTNTSGRYSVCGLTCGTYSVTPQDSRYCMDPLQVQQRACGASVTGLAFTAGAPSRCTTPPAPAVTPTPTAPPVVQELAAWANDGEDKVTKDELRMARGGAGVINSVWNGSEIKLFGAKNEVVNFNLIIEAALVDLQNVQVSFNSLVSPNGARIGSNPASGDGIFTYVGRNIELFYVRYLQIKGLSILGYEKYDERHIPTRLRRPHSGPEGTGVWSDRPDHDKYYPDIAVPMEAVPSFTIAKGANQSVWADIYIPSNAPAGNYTGTLTISQGGAVKKVIPVTLTVRNFTLPDTPNSKTMLYLGYPDINKRYLNNPYPQSQAELAQSAQIRNRHFQMAHRHKISLIDDNDNLGTSIDQPSTDWKARLSGSLFTSARGYDGPGVNTGNLVFSIGTYGKWDNWGPTQATIGAHADNWVKWFDANAPQTEYFLYLIDEDRNTARTNNWAQMLNTWSGVGNRLMSFATLSAPIAYVNTPQLDIPCSTGGLGITGQWDLAMASFTGRTDKRAYFYNGQRPLSGSFMIEDDGVALRELAWGQYKKNIKRWFYWESTYYNNYQAGMGQTNVFQQAKTFGGSGNVDPVLGQTGWNYSNGDGVLFYPGTDAVYPSDSYNLTGPLASLRLKFWRRGVQDVDYLTLAAQKNPAKVQAIINSVIPKALWEYGVDNPNDPTYVLTDISWSTNPDRWEQARLLLAQIIEQGS